MSEFVPRTKALKMKRSLSMVYCFKRWESKNPIIRRSAQLTRRDIAVQEISESLWTSASDNRAAKAGLYNEAEIPAQ